MAKIPILNQDCHEEYDIEVNIPPITCPYCRMSSIPKIHVAVFIEEFLDSNIYHLMTQCANSKCEQCFITIYRSHDQSISNMPNPPLNKKEFEDCIFKLSPSFCSIYNEAYSAEQMKLTQITGGGYRKAFEFLIKDYLISISPEKKTEIKKKSLSSCIKNDIDNETIKQLSVRVTWLGNDEAHYVRKWETKDVKDLKELIKSCVHWISFVIKTKKLLKEMPEIKK